MSCVSLAGPEQYGKIPIRNVWLLTLYASDFYSRQAGGTGGFAGEDAPEDIPDLVGEFLADAVEKRLSDALTCRYAPAVEELSRVRGKIDLLRTEQRKLLERGKIACRVERFTADTPRNRLVRAALERLAEKARPVLALRCARLAAKLRRRGIGGGRPSRAEFSAERFGQQDRADAIMVSAARLLFDLRLPMTVSGNHFFVSSHADMQLIRRLYEKAVAGFYNVMAVPFGWSVYPGVWQDWQISRHSPRAREIFPKMQLDIRLDHRESARRIIIDTKFNELTIKTLYHRERLRSHYVYQMYAYLRSQEKTDDSMSGSAQGILLHPSVDGTLADEYVTIQGHIIRFATVNLAGSTGEIRERLISLLKWSPDV